jgi:hypothetical protein
MSAITRSLGVRGIHERKRLSGKEHGYLRELGV